MKTLRLGQARVLLYANGLTLTRLPGGNVPALAQDDADYRRRAQDLGYGDDTALMSREHEVLHSLAAIWLGLPYSPTLHGVAVGAASPHWHLEEAFILGGQAYCRALGVSIVELAEAASA